MIWSIAYIVIAGVFAGLYCTVAEKTNGSYGAALILAAVWPVAIALTIGVVIAERGTRKCARKTTGG